MSEEEIIKEINIIKETVVDIFEYDLTKYIEEIYRLDTKQVSAILGLLELYKQEKEKNKKYEYFEAVADELTKGIEEYKNENASLKKEIKLMKSVNINENFISKEIIRNKLDELKDKEQELTDEQGYWGSNELLEKIEILEELLGE